MSKKNTKKVQLSEDMDDDKVKRKNKKNDPISGNVDRTN